ncbi:MAG: septal ring lytic transglycosylase RlpA family protein [Alphaproteobacteria bacterium]
MLLLRLCACLRPGLSVVCIRRTGFLILLCLILAVAGCRTRPPSSTVPVGPIADPFTSGVYKVGKPYKVAGVWYRPTEDWDYRAEGTASWYGTFFHGRRTANGEVFDKTRLTAAHPTLPLPSFVEVTNLANGRRIVVRVNDRGPFRKRRIIDLSEAAAEALDFVIQGHTRVRLRMLGRAPVGVAAGPDGGLTTRKASAVSPRSAEPTRLASADPRPMLPSPAPEPKVPGPSLTLEALIADRLDPSEPAVPTAPIVPTSQGTNGPAFEEVDGLGLTSAMATRSIYLQIGAFRTASRARRVADGVAEMGGERLAALATPSISQVTTETGRLYRVRVGPFDTLGTLDIADTLLRRMGYGSPTLVEDQ